MDIEFIKKQGDALFDGRSQLMSLWQEIAENFYPERAIFTASKEPGADFANNLDTSYPVLVRRDLGNQIGGILRPTNKEWMSLISKYDENIDTEGKQWLEWATKVQKRAMYDPVAMFTRATKEADHDWAAFGQTPITARLNLQENALLYRTWHLKDVAWKEDYKGEVETVYRKWNPDLYTLASIFKDKCHKDVQEKCKKNPFDTIEVYHCEIPSSMYKDGFYADKYPLVSIYYDCKNNHVMEETGIMEGEYVIPRWQTISGSQYAFSPATICALPDARTIQSVARVLLEASEKHITPPMVAVQEAIRGDISVYAGGITWVDSEYDERLGEVLRELDQKGNLPIGFEMNTDLRSILSEAFYLNKLALPQPEPNMTAYEASQRVEEYIRQALPLFEPMEDEYNSKLCNKTFNILMRAGAFGTPQSIPKSLQGKEIGFRFESPMREATDRIKGQRFTETKEMIASAMELDSTAGYVVDPVVALRDVLDAIGSPSKWRRSEQAVSELKQQAIETQQNQQTMTDMQQGTDIAKTANDAGLL